MKKNAYYYFGVVSYIGFAVAVPIAAGAFLGNLLDKKFHTQPALLIVLLLLGVADAFYNFIKIIQFLTKDD